jgi:hypothetical protein
VSRMAPHARFAIAVALALGCSVNQAGISTKATRSDGSLPDSGSIKDVALADTGVAGKDGPLTSIGTGGSAGSGGRFGAGGGSGGVSSTGGSSGTGGGRGGVPGTGGSSGSGGVAGGGTGGATGSGTGGVAGIGSGSGGVAGIGSGSGGSLGGSTGTGGRIGTGGAAGGGAGGRATGGAGGSSLPGTGGHTSCAAYPNAQAFVTSDNLTHCYWVQSQKLTWSDAKAACESGNGHLVTLQSSAENAFVSQLDSTPGASLWTGGTDGREGTDSRGQGTYGWITGEAWGYQDWAATQPDGRCDGCGGIPASCHCDHRVVIGANGGWSDWWEGTTIASICEAMAQ